MSLNNPANQGAEVSNAFPPAIHSNSIQPAGSVVIAGFGGGLAVRVFIVGGEEPDMHIDLWSEAGKSALTAANFIFSSPIR